MRVQMTTVNNIRPTFDGCHDLYIQLHSLDATGGVGISFILPAIRWITVTIASPWLVFSKFSGDERSSLVSMSSIYLSLKAQLNEIYLSAELAAPALRIMALILAQGARSDSMGQRATTGIGVWFQPGLSCEVALSNRTL